MSTALNGPMTVEAFLAWEESQPMRFEFDGFERRTTMKRSADHARVQRSKENVQTCPGCYGCLWGRASRTGKPARGVLVWT